MSLRAECPLRIGTGQPMQSKLPFRPAPSLEACTFLFLQMIVPGRNGSLVHTDCRFFSSQSLKASRNHARCPSLGYHAPTLDRKSTRLNSSHVEISYAVF